MTPEEDAKRFYKEEWGDEAMAIHSKCMLDACVRMIEGTNLDPVVFQIAGWIHDLGRKVDVDRHKELGVDFLNRFLEQHPEYEEYKERAADCILHHGRAGSPETIYGRIFQVADKVSLQDKRWIAYIN